MLSVFTEPLQVVDKFFARYLFVVVLVHGIKELLNCNLPVVLCREMKEGI